MQHSSFTVLRGVPDRSHLGECYRKLGDLDRAREHLQRGQATVGALDDDGYGQMIRGGVDQLAQRLTPTVCSMASDEVKTRGGHTLSVPSGMAASMPAHVDRRQGLRSDP
jgi:hypothetical protein